MSCTSLALVRVEQQSTTARRDAVLPYSRVCVCAAACTNKTRTRRTTHTNHKRAREEKEYDSKGTNSVEYMEHELSDLHNILAIATTYSYSRYRELERDSGDAASGRTRSKTDNKIHRNVRGDAQLQTYCARTATHQERRVVSLKSATQHEIPLPWDPLSTLSLHTVA